MRGVDVSLFNDLLTGTRSKTQALNSPFVVQVTANRDSTKLFNATSTVHTALA